MVRKVLFIYKTIGVHEAKKGGFKRGISRTFSADLFSPKIIAKQNTSKKISGFAIVKPSRRSEVLGM